MESGLSMSGDLLGPLLGEVDWRAEEKMIVKGGHRVTREDLLMMHDSLCKEAKNLMIQKNHDYAAEGDPFRNFRLFGALGILVRMSDKLARLRTFEETKSFAVKDESARDTVLDLINYSVLLHGFLLDSGALKKESK